MCLNLTRPILILAVDDEIALCGLTKEFLENSGSIMVDMTGSAQEARVAIALKRYDAIVSDYQMPGEDGIQFLKSLRASGDMIPFILFTGKGREEIVIEAINCRADGYLQKGGDPRALFAELEDRVNKTVRKKRAEMALLDSESEFRTLFENNPDPVVLVGIDGKILNTNQAGARMVQMSKEEIIGGSFVDMKVFRKEDVVNFRHAMISILKGEPISPIISMITRRDGTVKWVEIRSSVVRKSEGNVAFQIIARDITDHIHAEELLRRSEGKYRAIFNEAAVGITTIARDGKPLEFNNRLADYLGYSREELGHMSFIELTHPDDLQSNIALFNELVTGKIDHFEIEKRYVRKDGEIVWARLYEKLVEAKQNELPLILGIVDDLTELKRAQEAQKESNNRLETLVKTIPDMIWLKDADGVFLSCNRMFERLFGANEEDIVGKTDYDFVDHELADFFRENDRKAIGAGIPTSNEEWLTFKDDCHRALYETIKTPMYDARGALIGVLGVGRDITERKRVEESLAQNNEELNSVNQQLAAMEEELRKHLDATIHSEDELRKEKAFSESLMDSLPGIFYLYDAQTMRLVRWNKNHQEMSGYSDEEMSGMHVMDWHRAEDEKEVLAGVDRCMTEGHVVIETPLVMKDGREVPYLLTGNRFDMNGRSYLMGVGTEIMERKRAEDALRKSEERYSKLLATIPDLVIMTDMDGNIVLVNEPTLTLSGYTMEEVIGQSLFSFMVPDEMAKAINNMRMRIKDKLDLVEYHLVMKDGSLILFEANGNVLRDPKGRPTGYVFVGRDVTEPRQLEFRLKEANRKLRVMDSITRHDISNQLMMLSGNLALLDKKEPGHDPDKYLSNATVAVRSIATMIQFTKEYEKVGVKEPIWQDIRNLIDWSAKEVYLGPIILINDVPSGMELFADPMIIKVFFNLMENVLHHGKGSTTIHFSLEERNGSKTIVCEDNGPGISPNIREKLFTKDFGTDHGLGLFLSREILGITGIVINEEGITGKGAKFVMIAPPSGLRPV